MNVDTTHTTPSLPQMELPKANKESMQHSGNSLANEMKDIRKAKLQRQVLADPSLAAKLVATQASPTYNASGEVSQAVSTNLGSV